MQRHRNVSLSPATRARILAGAADAFGRLGYAATRVEDILLAANVSRPTFYKFFKSKDMVFQALSEIHHAEILARVAAETEAADGTANMLDRIVETFLRWRAALGPVGRVLDAEARVPNSRLQAHRQQVLGAVLNKVQAALRRVSRETVDPLLLRALIAAAENIADSFAGKPKVKKAAFDRRRAILSRLVRSALAEPGDHVPPLPRARQQSR